MHFEIRLIVISSEILNRLPLKNNSVTIGLNFLLAFISAITTLLMLFFSLIDYSRPNFNRHYQFFVDNQ